MDSFEYVTEMIYNNDGSVKQPDRMDNLHYQIQTLVYLTRNNPEWPDIVVRDIQEYVSNCIDLMEKM